MDENDGVSSVLGDLAVFISLTLRCAYLKLTLILGLTVLVDFLFGLLDCSLQQRMTQHFSTHEGPCKQC